MQLHNCKAFNDMPPRTNFHNNLQPPPMTSFPNRQTHFPVAENRSWVYRRFMAGGIDQDDPDNKVDNKEHKLMAFFKNQVAAVINNKWMKGVIILSFALYLVGAFYGITQMKEGLERRKLSKEGSYSINFFDLEDEYYREFPYRIQVSCRWSDLNAQLLRNYQSLRRE